MNITELVAYLEGHSVKVDAVNGKVNGLTFSQSTITSSDAWALVEEHGLKAPPMDSVPVVEPNWGQFRIDMLNDTGYKAVANQTLTLTGGMLLVVRVESEIREQDTNLDILKILWQDLLNAVLVKPSSTTITKWNQYCTASNMPFRFGANGSLTIT